MMLHTAEIVYPTYQLSVTYLFKLRLLLTSKYTSHTYITHHPLRIKLCHTMNITDE
ncbi:Adenosine 3'-phospho 5'-phosphosulfate transporter 2 [Gossypium arboreum]|uniref:Adenosine 3'-phospho 5'-phosphosulfate transporter 2 n=1 Tax=Gossypium arboreum TaxID=29729 RepID=A0A0B0MLR4_GOSAR|nr:Adenosine 3'-phospho 5'-phosphosulfate transporter 2 [Gossypium arboreum]